MKRLSIVIVLFFVCTILFADNEFIIESFKQLPNDMAASLESKKDGNNEYCALIKVKTGIKEDIDFDSGLKFNPSEKKKPGEYWVYVSQGEGRLTLYAEGFTPKHYNISEDIELKETYELVVKAKEENIIPVVILTDPSDAEKWLDGELLGKGNSFKISPGTYKLAVKKNRYKDYTREINIDMDNALYKDIELEKIIPATININTIPTGARVYINNIEHKYMTEIVDSLYPGEYELKLCLDGYLDKKEKIVIEERQELSRSYRLVKNIGKLVLNISPSDADIKINGNSYQSGQIELIPGKYSISVSKSGYLSRDEDITLALGETLSRSYSLVKNAGKLDLSISPKDADIKINGNSNQSGQIELIPGKYSISVSKSGYLSKDEDITVQLGKTVSRSYSLIKNAGTLDLSVSPSDAIILINNKSYDHHKEIELAPGTFKLKIFKEGWYADEEILTLKFGEILKKSYTLKQKIGSFQLSVKPLDAKVEIYNSLGKLYKTWTGMLFDKDIQVGNYEIITRFEGHHTEVHNFTIIENKTTVLDIQMKKGLIREVFVKGGRFRMGSTAGGDNEPIHSVTLSDYYIGKYEVTQAEYKIIMEKTPSYFIGDNHPVEGVSWYDAVEFCNKLSEKKGLQKVYMKKIGGNVTANFSKNGYRLPTEAEWEYAARGGRDSQGYIYSGSNTLEDVAWYSSNSGKQIQTIGQKQPNELGLYDMSGNVAEWCWDWYGDYSSSKQIDPRGSRAGSFRILRGGSWDRDASNSQVSDRRYYIPYYDFESIGFRLARNGK